MRIVSNVLKQLMDNKKRIPDYKLYAYKPSIDSYSKIVTGVAPCSPLDITPYCSDISWTPSQLSFTLKDTGGLFHPDTGGYKDYLADSCIVRLKEGDVRVDESEWMWTFTGQIKGQLGWTKDRSKKQLEAKCDVFSRENTNAFKKRQITTKDYSLGTDLGIMLDDILMLMGITPPESRVSPTLGRNFYFNTNQIAMMTPWDSMTTLLQTVLQVPFFDGEGKFASYSKNLNRPAALVLPDFFDVHLEEVTAFTGDAYNQVRVVFLDSVLSEVDSPPQKLGDAAVTTGFFTFQEKLICWWSKDHTQRAKDTYMKTIKGINDNLVPFIGHESYHENDLYHGTITVSVDIWVPIVATVMVAIYVAAALLPDETVPIKSGSACPGMGTELSTGPYGGPVMGTIVVDQITPTPLFGFTIPWGRVIQAAAMAAIMAITMCLGSCQYEVWGTPFDMVYLEKQSIAVVDGTAYWDINELKIQNDFIGIHSWADVLAVTELCFQQSIAKPRRLIMDDYLGLEVGDIIQFPDGRKVFVNTMKKPIKRGTTPAIEISGFKVLAY